jgi:hypothetical protein
MEEDIIRDQRALEEEEGEEETIEEIIINMGAG